MNERFEELLDTVCRTACDVSDVAADTVHSVGRKAGELLSVAKENIRLMELEGEIDTALQEAGAMIYATHTGSPTDSDVLLAKLEQIDELYARKAVLQHGITQLKETRICPICGAEQPMGDVFCRECGGKL